ncbi:MAG: phosphatidylserine decarboxylase [Bacteroidales bacterium]|nr:phosphatidylserine decarboxylase [Bacteroidales bacterium]
MKYLFVFFYRVDLSDSEFPAEHYDSVQSLFCRRLKLNSRKLGNGLVSPVDGYISESGLINNDMLIQAKNINYKLDKLLPSEYSKIFSNGWYCTIYLAPYNYHRIHSPVSGFVESFYYQPGDFWPVNSLTINKVKGLFNINERISTIINTKDYSVCIVKVAAMGVGNIVLSYLNYNKYSIGLNKMENPLKINKFDEIGMFAFGSTVILLCNAKVDYNIGVSLKNKIINAGETLFNIH